MKIAAWLPTFSLFVCATTAGASAQPNSEEISRGHRLALLACAPCHVVASDQETAPILRTPGPRFDAIANRTGTTADSLRAFLSTTHAKMSIPNGMPNPRLADYQMTEIVSYILSLRK